MKSDPLQLQIFYASVSRLWLYENKVLQHRPKRKFLKNDEEISKKFFKKLFRNISHTFFFNVSVLVKLSGKFEKNI